MGIMHLSTADKYLTATVALGGVTDIPVPAAWVTNGCDLLQLELWSTASWTLQDLSGGDALTIAADDHITLAVRINRAKGDVAGMIRAGGAGTLNILAHALRHAYDDQTKIFG